MFSGSSEAHHCRGVIDGLAFLPIVDLPVAMSYLHRNIPDVDRVAELVTYFDNTYVSGTVRRPNTDAEDGRFLLRLTRSPPLLPPQVWNVHESTVNGMDRTNNVSEGWNHAFASMVGHSHPSVWRIQAALQQN